MKRLPLCAAMAWAALSGSVGAHEIGTTQIAASFESDGAYVLDVSVDPDALLTLLSIRANQRVEAVLDRETRDRQIAELKPVFLESIDLRFDGSRARPNFEYRPSSASADLARLPSVVRLTGRHPGASAFTVSYALAAGSFAMTVRAPQGAVRTLWLEGGTESPPVSLDGRGWSSSRSAAAARYFQLGFTHILPRGFNHVLMVLGVFFLGSRRRVALMQVGCFTVAHALALVLTSFGVVSVPLRLVEPIIAPLAAVLAIENLLIAEVRSWRVAMLLSVGFLHGMGFAGVLRELNLPRVELLTALTTFNLGVEAAQLAVVALAIAVVGHLRQNSAIYRPLVVQPASLGIAATGVFWMVLRLLY